MWTFITARGFLKKKINKKNHSKLSDLHVGPWRVLEIGYSNLKSEKLEFQMDFNSRKIRISNALN